MISPVVQAVHPFPPRTSCTTNSSVGRAPQLPLQNPAAPYNNCIHLTSANEVHHLASVLGFSGSTAINESSSYRSFLLSPGLQREAPSTEVSAVLVSLLPAHLYSLGRWRSLLTFLGKQSSAESFVLPTWYVHFPESWYAHFPEYFSTFFRGQSWHQQPHWAGATTFPMFSGTIPLHHPSEFYART